MCRLPLFRGGLFLTNWPGVPACGRLALISMAEFLLGSTDLTGATRLLRSAKRMESRELLLNLES